ncbi:MAG: PAS domain-containing protein, partial [Planctomycetota bacterium]
MSTQNQKQPGKSTKAGDKRQEQSEAPKSVSLNLADTIIESLGTGVVACDRTLRIIWANSRAPALIDLGEYIDRSLAAGTDAKVWGNWTKLLKSTITTGRNGDFRAVRYNFDGRKKLLHIVCAPLREASAQQASGAVVVIEDVTAQADVEGQLAQAERFAAVGKVASKVAHELNNPMDGIMRYLNLAIRVIAR